MAIEFRVQGQNNDVVAEELAVYVRSMFGVETTVRKPAPEMGPDDGPGRVRGLIELVVLSVHVAVTAHAVYEKYVQEPYEKCVAKWRELVFFAKEKRPTLIHAVINNQTVVLHESDPERLHELTRKALDSAVVTTE